MARDERGGRFWDRNDQMLAGEMHPLVRVAWVAMMGAIGLATMAALWLATR